MSIFDSIILGVIEGLTEFLPISSTAHLMLASHFLGLGNSGFIKTFEIAIQSGAMLAVIAIYWKSFFDKAVLSRIVLAFVPTAIIGLSLYSFVKGHLLNNLFIMSLALAIGGIILILFERNEERKKALGIKVNELSITELSWKKFVLIGVIQALAIVPGVSRSGATIIGGRILGLSRTAVVEFSFLLAVPTIFSATVLDLYKNFDVVINSDLLILAIGFVSSGITAFVCIKWLLAYIRSHSFVSFGIYRIIVAIFVILLVI
jgi:undecaprenyl-diphosphatase